MLFLGISLAGISAHAQQQDESKNPYYKPAAGGKVKHTDAEWKKVLSPKVYNIMREKGTEQANTGPYVHNEKKGIYHCAACGHPLFSSAHKFDSHTGWPSFYRAMEIGSVSKKTDKSGGMVREEIMCAHCGGHLGHVFDDGPEPSGLRYCINGFALNFEEKK